MGSRHHRVHRLMQAARRTSMRRCVSAAILAVMSTSSCRCVAASASRLCCASSICASRSLCATRTTTMFNCFYIAPKPGETDLEISGVLKLHTINQVPSNVASLLTAFSRPSTHQTSRHRGRHHRAPCSFEHKARQNRHEALASAAAHLQLLDVRRLARSVRGLVRGEPPQRRLLLGCIGAVLLQSWVGHWWSLTSGNDQRQRRAAHRHDQQYALHECTCVLTAPCVPRSKSHTALVL